MSMKPHYPKEVFWSAEDEGFIAVARDLPGCSAFGDSEAQAIKELDGAIEAWTESMTAAGNPIPEPSSRQPEPQVSGKLLLRLPKSLHQKLADCAKADNTSVNQLVVHCLSTSLASHAVETSIARVEQLLQASLESTATSNALGHNMLMVVGTGSAVNIDRFIANELVHSPWPPEVSNVVPIETKFTNLSDEAVDWQIFKPSDPVGIPNPAVISKMGRENA